MSAEKIISEWKIGAFKPVYWLEGEEPYYIDQVVNYAEHKLLPPGEADFNLSVFYGREADLNTVINACRRYPMFAERQVVLIKEAQNMRDVEKLEGYIANPMATTILVISYKDKKVDARTKFAKLLNKQGEVLTTKKLYDNQLPDWTNKMVQQHGLTINQKALLLLVDHIGNDLNRLQNEVEKLAVNLINRKEITTDDIEEYIGVSKEFNVFELQDAFMKKDLAKAIRIIQYFDSNPKAGPIQMILPTIYNFFSKLYILASLPSRDEKSVASALGVHTFFVKDYIAASSRYNFTSTENALLLLHKYNLRSIGIHDAGTSDGGLMKELVYKTMA